MENILALETMKEGHDGSGLGLMFKDLGGVFEDFKNYPILSGIFSDKGLELLDDLMKVRGFAEKFTWVPKIKPVPGVLSRDHYLARQQKSPASWRQREMWSRPNGRRFHPAPCDRRTGQQERSDRLKFQKSCSRSWPPTLSYFECRQVTGRCRLYYRLPWALAIKGQVIGHY